MPIYAYKCSSCQHQLDMLQKISDAPLAVCPSCGAPTLAKQLTAAGFQLKGSGWYATDFKGGSAGGGEAKAEPAAAQPAKDGAPKEGAAKDGAPKDAAPKDAPPQGAAPKDAAPAHPGGSGA